MISNIKKDPFGATLAGAKIEGSLNNVFNPLYRQEWRDVGMGISAWVTPNAIPSWAANAGSGAVQTEIGGNVQNSMESKK